MVQSSRNRSFAAATLGAIAMLALTAPSVQAAGKLPRVLNGQAHSQALQISVDIPQPSELRAALVAAGYPVAALPAVDLPRQLDQAITVALNTANVAKTGADTKAFGDAAPLVGSVSAPKSSTTCAEASCAGGQTTGQTIVLPQPLPLGSITVTGSSSETPTYLDTAQTTGLVDVDLSLEPLLGQGKTLAAVGAALDSVATQINTALVPVVNTQIDTVKKTIDGVAALAPLKSELDRIVTVDHVKPLPAFSTADLVTARVLGGTAKVFDETRGAMTGLRARSESQVVDLQLLGGWASIDSIHVVAEAFANSVKGANGATATSKTDVANVDLGGVLGIHVSAADAIRLSQSSTLKKVARETLAELGVKQDITSIENAIEILYDMAGLSIVELDNSRIVGPSGQSAEATANSLEIRMQPKVPNLQKLQTGLAAGTVPALADSDYVPLGITITVDLPSATAAVGATDVQGFCIGSCVPVTGVGTNMLFAVGLIGAALGVRRFGLSR